MSTMPKPNLVSLSKNALISAAETIASDIYELLPEFPESEKWDTAARIHQGAVYLLNNVARAVGNSSPTGTEYDWGNARKEAASVLTMVRFAVKQGFLQRNSDLILKLTDLVKKIDTETERALKRRLDYEHYELSLWEDKYDIWKKLSSEIGK